MKSFNSIVVTGASSGIGRALALAYAAPGIHLGLNGRDPARLHEVASACRALGAGVRSEAIDVMQRREMAVWLHALDIAHPVDLVVANAGVSIEHGDATGLDEEVTRRTFAINFEGTLNSVFPLLPAMRRRHRGQIAIMASLAGFVGLPGTPAYNGSKAALRVWGESLRHGLRADGIGVSVICPGFVDTPMNARDAGARPFLMSPARAAFLITRGIARNRARIAFPALPKTAIWAACALPGGLLDWMLRRSLRAD